MLNEHDIYWVIRDANSLEEKREAARKISVAFQAELEKLKTKEKRKRGRKSK